MKHWTLLFLVLAACGTGPEPSLPPLNEAAATTGSDSLYMSRTWGTVTGMDGELYVIRSGRYCDECDAEVALYVHAPAKGGLALANGANAHLQPGSITDGGTGKVVQESRAFFGEVLPGVPGVIWYERSLETDGTMKDRTILLDLTSGMENSSQPGAILLDKTLALLAEGKCTEIIGIDRTTPP